jgi:hypothetical protein
VYVLAPSKRAAFQWLYTESQATHDLPLIHAMTPGVILDGEPGLLYVLVPGIMQLPNWPDLLDALVKRDARHA